MVETINMNKNTTITIIVIVLVVIGAGYYFMTTGGQPSGSSDALLSQTAADQAAVGADQLALLNQINNIKIHADFFQSDMFLSLNSVVYQIPTGTMARPNPFAPVPNVPSPFASSVVETPPPATLSAALAKPSGVKK